ISLSPMVIMSLGFAPPPLSWGRMCTSRASRGQGICSTLTCHNPYRETAAEVRSSACRLIDQNRDRALLHDIYDRLQFDCFGARSAEILCRIPGCEGDLVRDPPG